MKETFAFHVIFFAKLTTEIGLKDQNVFRHTY